MTPLSQGGSYTAEDQLAAGYALVQLYLTHGIEVVAGARIENSKVTVETQPTIGEPVTTSPEYTDVLPSLSVNFTLSERHKLRLAASQTLSRPEYRELAPVQYREVIGAENVLGNPNLTRALIQNFDVRWEFYPNPGRGPERGAVLQALRRPDRTGLPRDLGHPDHQLPQCRVGAQHRGRARAAEEPRRMLGQSLLPWSVFANATFMNSQVTIPGNGLAINSERAMVGQAPYVVNGGLTYLSNSGQLERDPALQRGGTPDRERGREPVAERVRGGAARDRLLAPVPGGAAALRASSTRRTCSTTRPS